MSARRRSCRRTVSSSTAATTAADERLEILETGRRVALPHDLQLHPACPREIEVTRAIGEVKLRLAQGYK